MRLKEGDPKGRHVVIVDDLVQSGGTLIECQVSPNHLSAYPPTILIVRLSTVVSNYWKKSLFETSFCIPHLQEF